MTPIPTCLLVGLRARLAGPSLDRELAAGCDPAGSAVLAARGRVLSSRRRRRRIAAGLRGALADTHRRSDRSAAVACNRQAVRIAYPAVEQLECAIRERRAVEPQGLALAQLLLSDPQSALYLPSHPERLYEVARAALLALSPREVDTWRVQGPAPPQVARVG